MFFGKYFLALPSFGAIFLLSLHKILKMETIEKMSAERCSTIKFNNIVNLSDRNSVALNLYLVRFQTYPNSISVEGIDIEKTAEWFFKTHKDEITDCDYAKSINKKGKMLMTDAQFFLFDDLFVYLGQQYGNTMAVLLFRKTDHNLVEKIAKELSKFKHKKKHEEPEIMLLVKGYDGLETKILPITKPKLTIEDNYNSDFLPIHKTILRRLQKENDKGLVLLHGKPGTGKTSYIRYLITILKKDVIFLPPNMAGSITDPGLMSVMIENPNSVFVIEDAENIIIDRQHNEGSAVSALLNLADGLLSDCLNIQIICSFNTDLSRVDNALMRKGRLIAKYEFKELETQKAQALSRKLGFDTQITEPMTLATVYNQDDADFAPTVQRKTIGFY